MASIIYNKKTIVSQGFNSRKTHPLTLKFGKHSDAICIHAELAALIGAKQDVTGMNMAVARVLKNGTPALAKPCEGCFRAIISYGIADVIWTL